MKKQNKEKISKIWQCKQAKDFIVAQFANRRLWANFMAICQA